jgi:putative flippase GtrA
MVVDWFYPLFRRFMPQQTYRYAACGGFNTVLDILLFFVGYNYVFQKQPIPIYASIIITPHIAAFLFAFLFTFPIGFYLSRYVVWQQTDTAKREQLMKYFIVVFGCIGLNYMFLKILVEFFGWYPTPAKILTTVFVVMFSYLSQKNYTFKS